MQGHIRIALGLGTALLATGALWGCSKGGGGGAAQSFNEAPAATAYTITPGQYETTVKMTNATVEGFPPEMQQRLQQMQNNPQTQRGCIPIGFSLKSASLRNLRFTLPNNMGGCNIGEVSQEGGTMRGNLSCDIRNLPQGNPNAPRAVSMSANWNGTYSPDSTSTFTMHAEANEPGGTHRGNVDIEISTRRVGDCPAGANPFGPTPPRPTMPPPTMEDMNTMTSNSMGEMNNASDDAMNDANMSTGRK